MSTTTFTDSKSFSITDAKKLASQVATDLKRVQRLYGEPSDDSINSFELELIQFLKDGFLIEVTYGFRRNGQWISPTLIYTAKELAGGINDDPGKIHANADIKDSVFESFLIWNNAYSKMSPDQRKDFNGRVPFVRVDGNNSPINGYLSTDKSYSSGGVTLDRKIVRSNP